MVSTTTPTVIGIDVSQDNLDIFDSVSQKGTRIANQLAAIEDWIVQQPQSGAIYAFEPTGTYSDKLARTLEAHKRSYKLISPTSFHYYCQSRRIGNKNDKQAAKTLSQMGQQEHIEIYKPMSASLKQRRLLSKTINTLHKDRQRVSNRIHALEQLVPTVQQQQILKRYHEQIDLLDFQLEEFQKQLCELPEDELAEQRKLLLTINGMGAKSVDLLLSQTGGLHHFSEAKKLARFIGVSPGSHFSGSSVRKRSRTDKSGSSQVRACLYAATFSAVRYNRALGDLYNRLCERGKTKKQARIAVVNKLLQQAWHVVNKKQDFDNDYYHRQQAQKKQVGQQ